MCVLDIRAFAASASSARRSGDRAQLPSHVEVESGRQVRTSGDNHNEVYFGYTCARGRALPEQHSQPGRLLHSEKPISDRVPHPDLVEQAMAEIASAARKRDTGAVAS